MKNVSVSQWVDMFKQVGLSEQQMTLWHQLFEKNHPEAHQAFFEWLQVEPQKIAELRKKYSG